MFEYNFFISGDSAVLDLDFKHLDHDTTLHIFNSDSNPTSRLFLNLPRALTSTSLTDMWSIIELQGPSSDLIILINSNTHIHDGDLRGFKKLLITDHKILEKTNSSVILDESSNYESKLVIDNLKIRYAYLLCNQLELLKGGRIDKTLGVKLHGTDTKAKLLGLDDKNFLVLNNLNISSTIQTLEIDKVLTTGEFNNSLIGNLIVKDSIASQDWKLKAKQVKSFSLETRGIDNSINSDHIEITNLNFTRGKFYISSSSYINFRIAPNGACRGIDLVLDVSENTEQKGRVIFPAHKFNFEKITVINAQDVVIPVTGGNCRELIFENCVKVTMNNVIAKDVKFTNLTNWGRIVCNNSQILENFLIVGDVGAIFNKVEVKNLEGSGLCSFKFSSVTKCEMLKLNLNLDASNPLNDIISARQDSLSIRIENDGNEQAVISTILAKLSTFYIKGNAKLGKVLIQPIDKISTLFWVDITRGVTKLSLDCLCVAFDHDIEVARDGSISIIRTKNLLVGAEFFGSMSSTTSRNSVYVKAGNGIKFDGDLTVIEGGIALFSKCGDIFVQGVMKAKDTIIIAAASGAVSTHRAILDAKLITVYSHSNSYLSETILNAKEILSYTLGHYIQANSSNIKACNIVLIANGDVKISSSQMESNQLLIRGGGNTSIQDSEIVSYDLFIRSIHDFLLVNSNIRLVQYSHVIFANNPDESKDVIQGGFRVANDITIIGIFTENEQKILPKIQWQHIHFDSDIAVGDGKAYIDANKGFIVGSTLDATDSVIIKTAHSLEIVPLILYNEAIHAGGLNVNAIKEVASKINAGLIDIDAGKAVHFVGTLLKAAVGNIRADVINLLASPEDIKNNQGRVKILRDWGIDKPFEIDQVNVGRYFDFTTSTSIAQRIGNLSHHDNYASDNLSYTQIEGDITLDKSWHNKYDKLYLNAEKDKILIVSKNLQEIYRGAGGREAGKEAAYANRTVIGGNNIYLSADQLIMQGAKIEVKGDLQIVTKDGVHILPVAVHERLMYHHGSKTRIEESIVRQVISEINAGFIDIKAGGVLEAVSALIQATGVNLDVKELNLRAEYDIFEKHIYFTGKKKWYGGRNSWEDHTQDHLVIPTIINAGSIYAKISGDTTIEAAQILAREESVLQAGGNISLLPKYDIHLHDHTSKKSYLFKCHGGKLTINSSKTVKEHFYGETPAPTVYYSGGSFFAYSDGKIHLLGAKVIADNIYLIAPKGVKIEAAPYMQETLISISETGARCGFNIASGQASFSAELFKEMDKLQQTRLLYEAAEVMAKDKLVIESREGELEVISSKMRFAHGQIKVRGLKMHTHRETLTTEQSQTQVSAGLHIGVQEGLSAAIKRAGNLIDLFRNSFMKFPII